MARIPDRFDLLVRKARQCDDTARQADYVLGGLVALTTWYFLNSGAQEKPELAEVDCEGEKALLVFSNVGHIAEIAGEDVATAR